MNKPHKVRCYGGVKHGDLAEIGEDVSFLRASYTRWSGSSVLSEPMHEIDTYRLQTWRERRGRGCRSMKVALLEGRQLFREEQRQIDKDLEDVRWEPIDPPSLLGDFARWFVWCAYRHTGDFKYIREEILCDY